MKKFAILAIFVSLLASAFISCAQRPTPPKKDYTGWVPFMLEGNGTIYLSQDKVYPGGEIKLEAVFEKEMNRVGFGFEDQKTSATVSEIEPSTTWSDVLKVPDKPTPEWRELDFKKYKLAFVASPADSSPSVTLYAQFELVKPPQIKTTYDRKTPNTPQTITVISTSPLDKVTLLMPDGKEFPFKPDKTNLNFTTKQSLPDPATGTATIKVTDKLGFLGGERLFMEDKSKPRIYIRGQKKYNTLFSFSLELDDLQESYKLDLNPKGKDAYFESLLKYSSIKNSPLTTGILGISPDKKWFVLGAEAPLLFDKGVYREPQTNRKVEEISSFWFFLYNTQTGESHQIAPPRINILLESGPNERGSFVKEIGPLYFPVYWEDNKLYMVEQRKSERVYHEIYDSTIVHPSIGSGLQSHDHNATARGVVLDLNDFTLSPTDKVKPQRPWVQFADQSTGIVGYIGADDKTQGKLSNGIRSEGPPYLISDLEGKHVWTKDYIKSILPEKKEGKWWLGDVEFTSSALCKGKRYMLIKITYKDKEEIDKIKHMFDWEGGGYEKFVRRTQRKFYGLFDIETGKMEDMVELNDVEYAKNEKGDHPGKPAYYFYRYWPIPTMNSISTADYPTFLMAFSGWNEGGFIKPDEGGFVIAKFENGKISYGVKSQSSVNKERFEGNLFIR